MVDALFNTWPEATASSTVSLNNRAPAGALFLLASRKRDAAASSERRVGDIHQEDVAGLVEARALAFLVDAGDDHVAPFEGPVDPHSPIPMFESFE